MCKIQSEEIILPTKGRITMSNGFQKFISGKGFYLALAVCLAGAGAAAWVAVDKTINNIENAPLSETPPAQQEEPFTQPAEQKLQDVPKQENFDSHSDKAAKTPDKGEESLSANNDSSTPSLQPSVPPESSLEQQKSAEASTQPKMQQPSDDLSFALPVSGASITPFSGDMLVKNETLNDWRTHNGIDISAALGSAVTSSCDGIVTSVHADPMWGNVVEVTSGEYVITYAGLSDEIPVSEQTSVSAGQQIGSVGEIPCELSLEPHLHFDVKHNGKYVDPASLVK